MGYDNQYIRFDWAAKRMLRDKANFEVLEGLIKVLINEDVKIVEILESESNQESDDLKYNRVDIKARNSRGDLIIVEVQQARQYFYLKRMLYGVGRALTEDIHLGESYEKIKKVYSINIVYFDLGKGTDYVYHGQTVFRGIHSNDSLELNEKEQKGLCLLRPEDIFPEYFIIRVNEFDKVAKTPLDEWINYLKTGEIADDTTAPGLEAAKEKLQMLKMSPKERKAYYAHMDTIMTQNDTIATYRDEGYRDGERNTTIRIVRQMKDLGLSTETISKATGLTPEQIGEIIK